MLNAFRHHRLLRGVRALELSDYFFVLSAATRIFSHGVLNAFRHHRLLRETPPRPLPCPACAQRLSASQIIAHAVDGEILIGGRCSTPFGITDYCARRPRRRSLVVCIRAQRLSASQIIAPPGAQRDLVRRPIVLNAFRHHRLLRKSGTAVSPTETDQCSTPFGITDYCAFPEAHLVADQCRCSTPFGITDYCAL